MGFGCKYKLTTEFLHKHSDNSQVFSYCHKLKKKSAEIITNNDCKTKQINFLLESSNQLNLKL
jgi:hypothetical protein